MNIVCSKSDLAYGVHTASRAVSPRSTLPILSNILIYAKAGAPEEDQGGSVTLIATDLEIWIRCVIPAKVSVPGSLAVPAGLLGEVMNSLPETDVSLTVDENRLLVKWDTADYTILSLPAEEFPSLPEVGDETSCQIPQGLLKSVLKMTTFAASKEETRAILTGALMDIHDDEFSVVATDTHRLALMNSQLPQKIADATSVIVPARALNELQRVLHDQSETTVHVALAANQIQFSMDGLTIVSRVIDGQFPNYQKVIPKEVERRITVNTKEFLSVLKRVAIVARENANKAIFLTENNHFVIQAESQEAGRAYEELPIHLEGEDIEIAFNVQYFVDVLSVIDTEEVLIELTGPLNPGVIKPVGGREKDTYIYVLMPMQK